eukprot:585834-Amphidinium_carterae.1
MEWPKAAHGLECLTSSTCKHELYYVKCCGAPTSTFWLSASASCATQSSAIHAIASHKDPQTPAFNEHHTYIIILTTPL